MFQITVSKNDITSYFGNYTDAQCEEIVTELFKLPYEKSYREELLSKFNRRLFEGLIFYKRFRTYTRLIQEILFKQILKGKEDAFVQILKQHSDQSQQVKKQAGDNEKGDGQIETVQAKAAYEDGGDEQLVDGKDDDDVKEYSLAQIAAQFSFYEYFDTLHRFRIKVKSIEPQPSIRFLLQTNEQLLQLATQFEQQGYNYISNCVRMLRYLRLNHYNSDKISSTFESELMIGFITENANIIKSPCLNIIKEYLLLAERKAPFWQDTISRKVIIGKTKRQEQLKAKTIQQQILTILKVNGIERGVKFCFPSNYQPGNSEITNDDIRRTAVKKPTFTIDQYVEHLQPRNRQRLDNQIVNDPEFGQLLSKLLIPHKSLEFLIDKEKFQENLTFLNSNDHEMYYYILNFPMFWYEETLKKEDFQFIGFFHEFEFGLIFVKSTLLLEPKLIDQALEIYFQSIHKYVSSDDQGQGEGEEQEMKQEEHEESEYEEYEVEVTDDEAEQEENQQEKLDEAPAQEPPQQEAQQEKQPENNGLVSVQQADQGPGLDEYREEQQQQKDDDGAPQARGGEDQAPRIALTRAKPASQVPVNQAPVAQAPVEQNPKVKKTKKIMQRRKKQKGPKEQKFVESEKSLRKSIINNLNDQLRFQIFLQLLLFATTNEEVFRLIQKYLIQYESVSPQSIPLEIDPARKVRLLKDGFKEPFNLQFVEQMEQKAKELKQQQIEDIKHIKDVLTQNENQRHAEQSEVYQVLISSVLQTPFDGYQTYIDKLLESPAYKCLSRYKKSVVSHTLEKDQKLQMELRKFYSQTEKKQLSPDFLQKFFENNRVNQNQGGSFTNDKWINVICILNYCKQILNQIQKFDNDVELARYKINSQLNPISYYKDEKLVNPEFNINTQFSYKFKVSNKLEPIIYEYKKIADVSMLDGIEQQHNFFFELTYNIQKSTIPNNPYPVAQLQLKYVEEVVKTIETIYYDNYLVHINNLCTYPEFKVAQLSGSDNIDYIQLKTKLTKENFREYRELHYCNNFYLDQTIQNLEIYNNLLENNSEVNPIKILKELRDGIVLTESNDAEVNVKICNQNWLLYSSRIRPDIKLKYQDKLYPVPYSNYQPRQRNAQYKQSIQVDQSFPELFPIVNLQVYQYIPDVMTEEQFNQKYDQLSIIQQACYDLNSYAQSLDDFLTQSPSEEELQNLRDAAPQIVSWPIIRSKVKREKGFTEEYKFVHSQESHPLYMIEYLFRTVQLQLNHQLKFTFNVLSFTEIILFKLTRILQQTTGKRCKLSTSTSLLNEWTLLKKILLKIGDLILENELDKFRFYYVEINEVHQNSVFPIKSNKLEGMDAIFRFGQTQFFVHSNVLIIRLNIAVVSENASSLISQKNAKLKANEWCPILFKEDKELRGYMNYIITLEDMLKQIFTKK